MRSMYNEDRAEIRTAQFLSEQLENQGFQSFQVITYAPFLSCGDNKKTGHNSSARGLPYSLSRRSRLTCTLTKVRRNM